MKANDEMRSDELMRKDDVMSDNYKCGYDRTLIDADTGEVIELRAGSKIVSPERVEQQKQYAISANKTTTEKNKDYAESMRLRGTFFSVLCRDTEILWGDVSEPTLGKLIYLATFIDKNNCICKGGTWDKNGAELVRNPEPMCKSDIQSVLRVSYPTFRAFWSECENKQLIVESDGKFFLRREMFRFGVKSQSSPKKTRMVLMFKHAIRYMYENTDERSKKTLMYLYRLIPFINLTYNALCLNPFERCKENIQVLPLSKICEMFEIDPSNQLRFLRKLKSLRFVDKEGNLCSVIRYSWMYYNEDKYWITINPQFYSGYISEQDMINMVEEFRLETSDLEINF